MIENTVERHTQYEKYKILDAKSTENTWELMKFRIHLKNNINKKLNKNK